MHNDGHARHRAEVHRLARAKASKPHPDLSLGKDLIGFFKKDVSVRHKRFAGISDAWVQLVPETLNAHCALESFHRGTLTVLVDSAAHLYELKQLLLAGTQQQLLIACRSAGLRKIALKAGRWYHGDGEHNAKLKFE